MRVSVAGYGLGAIMLAASAAHAGEVYGYDLRGTDRLVSWDAPNPLIQTVIDPDTLTTGYETFGIDFNNAGDTMYIVNHTMGIGLHTLDSIDVGTGLYSPGIPITGAFIAGGVNETALANDPTAPANMMYLATGTDLYTLDTTTGNTVAVATFSGMSGGGAPVGLIIDISVDNAGLMFGHDITNDFLWSIDKTTGVCTFVGASALNANFAQGMDFDPDTNLLYCAIYISAGTGSYGTWDTTSGVFTQIEDNLNIPDGSNEFEICIRATPGPVNSGSAYCFGDGSGTLCPCGLNGAAGEGCLNSAGTGAVLTGSGNGSFSSDTFQLDVTGAPTAKPGLMLRGDNQINGGLGNPIGDGLICTAGNSARSQVQITSGAGTTTFTNFNGSAFGSVANAGTPTNFQFWYRDPVSICGGGFNFTNAWTITYVP